MGILLGWEGLFLGKGFWSFRQGNWRYSDKTFFGIATEKDKQASSLYDQNCEARNQKIANKVSVQFSLPYFWILLKKCEFMRRSQLKQRQNYLYNLQLDQETSFWLLDSLFSLVVLSLSLLPSRLSVWIRKPEPGTPGKCSSELPMVTRV